VPVRHMRLLGPAIVLALLVATVARADNEKLAEHLRGMPFLANEAKEFGIRPHLLSTRP
jgi:hypothetical protein